MQSLPSLRSVSVPATIFAIALASTATAQGVTVSVQAVTPLTIGHSQGNSGLPAGPLASTGFLATAASPSESVTMDWFATSDSTRTRVDWTHVLRGPTFAGSHEMLFEFQVSTATQVHFDLRNLFAADAGASLTQTEIDLGNNGVVNYAPSGSFEIEVVTTIQPSQPLQVRVRFAGVETSSFSLSRFSIDMTPNNHANVLPAVAGCMPASYEVLPSYVGEGIVARETSPLASPSVLVFGLTPQPVVLPTPNLPCVLYPSVDVALGFFGVGEIHVPLPSALRPIDLWIQRVALVQGQVLTDDAFRIDAN